LNQGFVFRSIQKEERNHSRHRGVKNEKDFSVITQRNNSHVPQNYFTLRLRAKIKLSHKVI
jgi:hypothetical protein